jgi:hypothetical protein
MLLLTIECEKLIRRMLQLDPNKRIPLSKVLEHKWMLTASDMNLFNTCPSLHKNFSGSGNVLWNEQVLLAIQRLNNPNFSLESVKQAVSKRLYNDHAALYYLYLSMWEKGQLQLMRTIPSLSFHGRYSTNTIPKINIDATTSNSHGIIPWQNLNPQNSNPPTSTSCSDSMIDDNLARYLNQGRRHTLGAAHHVLLVPTEEFNRLRKINESTSSQASSGFGSTNTNFLSTHEPFPSADNTLPTCDGTDNTDINNTTSSRQFLQLTYRSRRRASDGGHYLEAYRNFIHKRSNIHPQQVNMDTSNNQLSARQLLQDKIETDKLYGRLPPKNRIAQNSQMLTNEIESYTTQILQLSSSTAPLSYASDLRQQYQPFIDITQQQIREQLEQLHMNDSTMAMPTTSSGSCSITQGDSKGTMLAQLLAVPPPAITSYNSVPTQTVSMTSASYYDSYNVSQYQEIISSSSNDDKYEGVVEMLPEVQQDPLVIVEAGSSIYHQNSVISNAPFLDQGSTGIFSDNRQRKFGIQTPHITESANVLQPSYIKKSSPHVATQPDVSSHPSILLTHDTLQTVQQIPVYFNQNVSLIHPNVASQISQKQMSTLVSRICSVLQKFNIIYQCMNNVFTISHKGVDFQIHAQVSPHYSIPSALQLSLQYMHISGDPQLYQKLCTELAPHFVPNIQN